MKRIIILMVAILGIALISCNQDAQEEKYAFREYKTIAAKEFYDAQIPPSYVNKLADRIISNEDIHFVINCYIGGVSEDSLLSFPETVDYSDIYERMLGHSYGQERIQELLRVARAYDGFSLKHAEYLDEHRIMDVDRAREIKSMFRSEIREPYNYELFKLADSDIPLSDIELVCKKGMTNYYAIRSIMASQHRVALLKAIAALDMAEKYDLAQLEEIALKRYDTGLLNTYAPIYAIKDVLAMVRCGLGEEDIATIRRYTKKVGRTYDFSRLPEVSSNHEDIMRYIAMGERWELYFPIETMKVFEKNKVSTQELRQYCMQKR